MVPIGKEPINRTVRIGTNLNTCKEHLEIPSLRGPENKLVSTEIETQQKCRLFKTIKKLKLAHVNVNTGYRYPIIPNH